MIIKNFSQFNEGKSGKLYNYGCVMIHLQINNWEEITSMIDKDDIYNPKGGLPYGIETDPHISLLYGLHSDVTKEDVRHVLKKFRNRNFNIYIDGIGKFDNSKFSVVKFNIRSTVLNNINRELRTLPHTTEYPNYDPHMTIGFVKKGTADKYISSNYQKTIASVSKVIYKMTNGDEMEFEL